MSDNSRQLRAYFQSQLGFRLALTRTPASPQNTTNARSGLLYGLIGVALAVSTGAARRHENVRYSGGTRHEQAAWLELSDSR